MHTSPARLHASVRASERQTHSVENFPSVLQLTRRTLGMALLVVRFQFDKVKQAPIFQVLIRTQ